MLIFTQQRRTSYTGTLQQLEASAKSAMIHNLLLGWWGIPFGLIWTPMALARQCQGTAAGTCARRQPRTAAAAGTPRGGLLVNSG